MIFSTQQIKTTYNFMAQADEATIQTILARLKTDQLRKLLKTVERSIKNRLPTSESTCANCHRHAINVEGNVEFCDSCLAE